MRSKLIAEIIKREWEMFSNVSNKGGRASCQEDPKTFKIMRSSFMSIWSEKTLESYRKDLVRAQEDGRNLMTEKYARMMEFTSPEEYAQIKQHLPLLNAESFSVIDEIVKIDLEWKKELAIQYPHLHKRSRPLYSSEDTKYGTSFETYLRGELLTYSLKTLKLYYEDIQDLKVQNLNGSEMILDHTVKQYGFNSLAEANEKSK